MNTMNTTKFPLFLMIIGVSLTILGSSMRLISNTAKSTEEEVNHKHYCEMVEIGKSSNGEYGWPDFKKIYDKQCLAVDKTNETQ